MFLFKSRQKVSGGAAEGADLAQTFRKGMKKNASAVGLITAARGSKYYGLTAVSCISLAMDPPSLLVSVNKRASAHEAIVSTRRFAVILLGEGQEEHARRFADSARRGERFKHGVWSRRKDAAPVLEEGYAARFECDLHETLDVFSHSLIVGLVKRAAIGAAPPLVYSEGRYGRFEVRD